MRLFIPENETKNDRPIEVNHFRILIPVSGYCWLENATPSREFGEENHVRLQSPPYMVMKGRVDKPWRGFDGPGEPTPKDFQAIPEIPAREYRPLIETPDLFLRFSKLKMTCSAILRFANRYGWIGETGCVNYEKRGWIPATGLKIWTNEIQAMAVAAQLLTWAETNDRRKLRECFCWHPSEFDVRMAIGIYGRTIQGEVTKPQTKRGTPVSKWNEWLVKEGQAGWLEAIGWKRGELRGPALLAVMNIVNTRLERLCHPRLYLNERGGHTGHWTPLNLLGCIWLQFYLSLTGQLKLRRCTVCGEEMDVSKSRSTRKMHSKCSKKKRQQKWRANNKMEIPLDPDAHVRA